MRARCVSETLRAIAPEIVQGAYTEDEIQQINAQAPVSSQKVEEPKNVTPPKEDGLQHIYHTGDDFKKPEPEAVEAEVVEEKKDESPLPIAPYSMKPEAEAKLVEDEGQVNAFLIKLGRVKPGQTWRDLPKPYLQRIEAHTDAFISDVKGGSK